ILLVGAGAAFRMLKGPQAAFARQHLLGTPCRLESRACSAELMDEGFAYRVVAPARRIRAVLRHQAARPFTPIHDEVSRALVEEHVSQQIPLGGAVAGPGMPTGRTGAA